MRVKNFLLLLLASGLSASFSDSKTTREEALKPIDETGKISFEFFKDDDKKVNL